MTGAVGSVGNITQGPGSIAQIGGSGNQATSIGVVPPPARKLSDEEVSNLGRVASEHPFRILILYVQNDEEAYRLAKQIGDALSAGGWKLQQPVTGAMIMSEGGGPLYGMQLVWQGDAAPAATPVHLDPSTPWGALAKELMRDFPEEFHVQPSPNSESNFMRLEVFVNPRSKPAS